MLLIADEVMTGFGRTGRNFAVDHWGVVPDILVGGKGLAGGYAPMGGVYASDAVLAPLAARGEEFMFYTYAAHPAFVCRGARGARHPGARGTRRARRRTGQAAADRLRARWPTTRTSPKCVASVCCSPSNSCAIAPRSSPSRSRRSSRTGSSSRASVTALLLPGRRGSARDVVCLGPPFTIGDEEIDLIATALPRAIDDAARPNRNSRCRASSYFLSGY